MTKFRHWLLSMGLILAATSTHAALITLTPEESGRVRAGGGFVGTFGSHTQPLTTIRGYQIAMAGIVDNGGYLVFDTSSLAFTPVYATLLLDINDSLADLAGPGALQTWGLDIFTPADLAALPTGSLGGVDLSLAAAIRSDLTSGTRLADDVIGPMGETSIALNGTALAQITAANGLWGLGLYDNRFGSLLGGLDLLDTPRLLLSDQPFGTPIPAPATAGLLLGALVLLTRRRSSRANRPQP